MAAVAESWILAKAAKMDSWSKVQISKILPYWALVYIVPFVLYGFFDFMKPWSKTTPTHRLNP